MKLLDMIFGKKSEVPKIRDPHELRVARVESRATLRRVDRVLREIEAVEAIAERR